jgi:hypothetical protein
VYVSEFAALAITVDGTSLSTSDIVFLVLDAEDACDNAETVHDAQLSMPSINEDGTSIGGEMEDAITAALPAPGTYVVCYLPAAASVDGSALVPTAVGTVTLTVKDRASRVASVACWV